MQEVEVKARFNGTLLALKELLITHSAIEEHEWQQDDTIFLEKGMTFGDIRSGMPVPRVRTQNGQGVFTIKQKNYQNLLAAVELETHIDDAAEFTRMLDLMNFAPVLEVKKHRITFHLADMEICADEVAGLGVFIEVERMVPEDQAIQVIQSALWDFLEQLGMKTEDRVTKGYDNLLYEQSRIE